MTGIIDKTISHYRIIDLLGAGGMSVVYKALDVNLDRLVALKILPPHFAFEKESKERIIREAKVIDFGMSKILGQEGLTRDGAIVGTAEYMSPEQAQGLKIDARTDTWSLGVVLYEMLTGKHPFKTEYAQGLLYAILHKNPEKIKKFRTDVPVLLEKICAKALAKKPEARYQSIAEMQDDLEKIKQEQPSPDARMPKDRHKFISGNILNKFKPPPWFRVVRARNEQLVKSRFF